MPAEGISYEPKEHLLSYEEITRLLKVLGGLGFRKVRFTGGEPFLRKDFMRLLENAAGLSEYKSIHITSNGTLLQRHISRLQELGVTNINLSIDSLNRERFHKITRRDDFDKVMKTFHLLMEHGFNVKLNAVIMKGQNIEDIGPMARLAEKHKVDVRFIEEMPFNGGYKQNLEMYSASNILSDLKDAFPSLEKIDGKHGDTATLYKIADYKGSIGIIPAFSRTFCNTCNRLRIAANGEIKTCLYDGGVFNIKDFLRAGATDEALTKKFEELIRLKPKDGFAAEKSRKMGSKVLESMSSIGG